MGQIKFNPGKIEVIYGKPQYASFPRETRYISMELAQRALAIAPPPAEAVVAAAGQCALKDDVQVIFGSGQTTDADLEWRPTNLVIDGVRAWTLHREWCEGGGEGWFGPSIEHRWVVAGAWLRDNVLMTWAEEFSKHPIAQKILDDPTEQWIYLQEDELTFLDFYEEDQYWYHGDTDPDVLAGRCLPGVYRRYNAKFGNWSGYVLVHLPDFWQIRKRYFCESPVRYPYIECRNGKESRTYLPSKSMSPEEIDNFAAEADRENPVFSADLPCLPTYSPPIAAEGDYAAFFKTRDLLRNFMWRYNIRAPILSLGNHAPWEEEPVALSQEWVKKAWVEGATPLPPIAGEIPPLEKWKWMNGYHPSVKEVEIKVAEGISAKCNGQPNSNQYDFWLSGDGWIRVRSSQVRVPYGCTIRDVGDTSRGTCETVVYVDGRIRR